MSKLKKRILALGLSLVMILTTIPMLTSVALAEDAATVKVYLTVSNQGEIAKANDGSLMVCKEVTVTDLNEDGAFTYDEALVAAHAAFNSPDGFVAASSGWVTSVWGVANNAASYSFMQNDKGTDLVTTAVINEGDDLVVSINKDADEYSDFYTAFDVKQVEATVGEEVSLTLKGFGAMTQDEATPVSGIAIGYYNTNGEYVPTEVVTGEDGKANISFAEPGTYVVSGRGTYTQTIASWNYSQVSQDSDVFVKITDYTTFDMVVPYTEEDYGEGPYPFGELKFDLDYYDFDDMEEEEQAAIHYMKSNQVLMDSPIIAPVSVFTVKEAPVELTDGTYAIPGLSTAVLSMYHFDPDTARVVIKGNDAWLITSIDGTKEASTLNRFDGMAYGPQSEILDPSDETNHTLVEGAAVADVIDIYDDDKETVVGRTFVLPVPKEIFADGSDIYYMIKYRDGYNETHDGDWYKASGGDYYLTGYTLEKISDSTDLPRVELTVDNKYRMFLPTAATLITSDEGQFLELTYSSTSYDKSYAGNGKEAVVVADPAKLSERDADGKYLIPVEVIGEEFIVAFHSVKNEGWYDRIFKIDLDEKTLTTDTTGGAMVPDTYGNEWDEEVAVESSLGMFKIEATKVTVEDDGTATIIIKAGNTSREFPKIALVEQTVTEEEKEAAAIVGVATGDDNNNYIYEFSIPVDQLGEALPISHYQTRNGESEWHDWSAQATITINSVDVVNQLIGQIQIQKNNEYTEKYIEASKKCWEALPEDSKGEDDGYFSDDTGDASLDDPRNQDEIGEKEILVVSFGTSFNGSRVATIKAIEDAIAEAYPEYAVRREFTAQIIINLIWARDDEVIDNMEQALDRAVENNVKELVVQPTHLMHGAEYDEMCEVLAEYEDKFDKIFISEPLLNSDEDKTIVAKAVVDAAIADSDYDTLAEADADKTAIVLMGHGTAHEANVTYEEMQAVFDGLEYNNVFVGTVEGEPESTEVETVLAKVQDA